MRIRTLATLACAMLVLASCGRSSDSGWNPLGWFGGGSEPQTLAPDGGYPESLQDGRLPLARVVPADARGGAPSLVAMVAVAQALCGTLDATLRRQGAPASPPAVNGAEPLASMSA